MKRIVNSVKIKVLVLLIMGFAMSAMATFSFTPQAQADGPITSNWDGDSVSGSTALDTVGGNDGTIFPSTVIVPGPDGAGDNAFGFNGTHFSSIVVPDHPSLDVGTDDFSIDLWVRQDTDAIVGVRTMLDKRNPSNNWKGYVIYSQDGHPSIQLSGGTVDVNGNPIYTNFNSSAPVLIDGLWHHIIFTVDRDNPSGGVFYIDGVADANVFDPTIYSGSLDNTNVLRIGNRNDLRDNWIGDLDRINLYSRVITPEEVEVVVGGGSLGDADAVVMTFGIGPQSTYDGFRYSENGYTMEADNVFNFADTDSNAQSWYDTYTNPMFDSGYIETWHSGVTFKFTSDDNNPFDFVGIDIGHVNAYGGDGQGTWEIKGFRDTTEVESITVPTFPTPSSGSIDFSGFTSLTSLTIQKIGGLYPAFDNLRFTSLTPANNLPQASCKATTVYLDAGGNASITPADVNDGSFDPDGDTLGLSLSNATFDCSNVGSDPTTNTVTLTVMDGDGGSDSCDSVVTVVDNTDPTITVPEDKELECPADTTVGANGSATGTDNCNIVIVSHVDSSASGCGNTETITRTWTVTDLDGYSASGDQIITVVDTTAPVIDPVPADRTGANAVECSNVPLAESLGASDNCDGSVTSAMPNDDVINEGACAGSYTITRTWTATDECGNSTTTAAQTIEVVDTTAPVITCPADDTVECNSTGEYTAGEATATDNCDGNPSIGFADVTVPGNCVDNVTAVITRTWTATDACDNASSCDQTITIKDTTAPVIICPENGTVECNSTGEYTAGTATATDNCDDNPSITFADVSTPGNCVGKVKEVITRTWTATDACGNVSSCDQTITVKDTTAPDNVVATLVPVKVRKKHGCFRVEITAADNCDTEPLKFSAVLKTGTCEEAVTNGQLVRLHLKKKRCRIKHGDGSSDDGGSADCGTVKFEGPDFTLTATAEDACGNVSNPVTAPPVVFGHNGHSHDGHSHDGDSASGHKKHHGSDDDSHDNGIHRGNKKKDNHKDRGKHKSEGKSKKHDDGGGDDGGGR